ncbi:hypothetical protein BDU57DRAFT_564721, partial [Ampelomyces quisqualis]
MARLSVEHFRASATMTPEQVRKSSRFRDMFKSRSSMSPSTGASVTKLPLESSIASPPASPTSPTVKPGFETVGLLPSERISLVNAKTELENNGGTHVAEVLEEQKQELKGVGIPHNMDTALDDANVSRNDMAGKKTLENERAEEANVIAEAFGDAIAEHQAEAAEPSQDATPERSSTLGVREEKLSQHILRRCRSRQNLSISGSENPFLGNNITHSAARTEEIRNNQMHSIDPPQPGHVRFFDMKDSDVSRDYMVDSSEDDEAENSIADSNEFPKPAPTSVFTFPGRDPRSEEDALFDEQAENHSGSAEHSQRHVAGDNVFRKLQVPTTKSFLTGRPTRSLFAVNPAPTRIAVQINITGSLPASYTTTGSTGRKPTFGGPKSIASFALPNDLRSCALQLAVIILYFSIATYMLKIGVFGCVVALFALKVYGFAVTELGWEGDSTDILIAPMDFLEDLVVDWGCRAASKMTQVMAKSLVEALQNVADEFKVEAKTE